MLRICLGRGALALCGSGKPIATEGVGSTGDLIQLADGTILNLVGSNLTCSHDHRGQALRPTA
jgi:hypothetical protein